MPSPKKIHEKVQELRLRALSSLQARFAETSVGVHAADITAFGQLCNQAEGGDLRTELDTLTQRILALEDSQLRVTTSNEPGRTMNMG